MALKTGQGGEMSIVIRVRDDGTAVVEKFGDTSQKSADKASGAWEKTGKAMGVAAAAAVTTAALMIKSAIDMADATFQTAQKLGDTTAALSALQYTARAANVPTESLNASLLLMARNLSDAAQGTGEARFAIKDLGLDAQALANMKPSQAVAEIAQAMEGVSRQGDRVRIAMDIFGRSGADMVNVMRGGKAALAASAEEAQRFGRIITDDTGRAANKLKNEVQALQERLGGLSLEMARYTTPALIQMAEAMTTFANKDHAVFFQGLSTAMKSVAHVAIGLAAAMEDIGLKIGAVSAAGVAVAKFNFAEAKKIMQLHEQDSAEINKRMLESQAKLWQELPAIAAKANAAAANASRGETGASPTRNSRQEDENAKKLAQESERLTKEVLEIHRATLSEQIRAAEEYVQQYQTLDRARVIGVIKSDQELTERRIEIAQQYEAQLAELTLQDPVFQASEKLAQALESERAARQTGLQNRTADVLASLQTDQQIEDDRYAQQLATLAEANQTIIAATEEANARKLLEDDAYRQATEQAELQHKARMGDIHAQAQIEGLKFQKLTDAQKIQSILATGTQMTASVANSSKAMFNVNKAFALANTAVALPDAVIQSFEKGGGYPWGLIPAGLMLATGLANIAQIKAAQFGSSTSAPSIAGGGATPTFSAGSNLGPAQTPAPSVTSAPAMIINVTVQGNILGNREFVNETLIPELRQAINSRDITIIDANSRQSIEIRS